MMIVVYCFWIVVSNAYFQPLRPKTRWVKWQSGDGRLGHFSLNGQIRGLRMRRHDLVFSDPFPKKSKKKAVSLQEIEDNNDFNMKIQISQVFGYLKVS